MQTLRKALLLMALLPSLSQAQSELYPQHFDLEEVTLLDSPLKAAMDGNAQLLLQYDADRLLAPFIRQADLHTKSGSKYYGWLTKHPSFTNWGLSDWSLEGHVGGHYLTALSLAYAAVKDEALRAQLKTRLDYCIDVLKDCQDAFATNTQGLKGFIGGQPINQVWTGLYANNLTEFRKYGGWVPFYCEHKVLAGLRDAWIYTDNETARDLFRSLSDWAVAVISNLSDADMQTVLGWEHGGMNETLADAFALFGDMKYLEAAKRYSHQYEINGMQGNPYNPHFLDNQHANTQVPSVSSACGSNMLRVMMSLTIARRSSTSGTTWSLIAPSASVATAPRSISLTRPTASATSTTSTVPSRATATTC